MLRDTWEALGTVFGYGVQYTVVIFGLGVLWSYAVGAEGLISLAVAAIVGVLVGGFIGLATFSTHRAGMNSYLIFGPIFAVIAVIGAIVWIIRLMLP